MARVPKGPEKQPLTYFDGGLEHYPSGPFNGANPNNLLRGEELITYQNNEQLYGRDEAFKMMLVEQAKKAMELQKSNYKLSKGPLQPREQRPLVLSTKPAKTAPAKTAPAKTAPAKTGPAKTGPAKTGPAKTGSPRGAKGKMGGKYSKNVYKKVGKKEILGKERVIYKTKGSNKEYVKSKGMFTSVAEYKKNKQK
jgi:hypothetical protein